MAQVSQHTLQFAANNNASQPRAYKPAINPVRVGGNCGTAPLPIDFIGLRRVWKEELNLRVPDEHVAWKQMLDSPEDAKIASS